MLTTLRNTSRPASASFFAMIRIGSAAARRMPEGGHEVDVEHGLELLVGHLLDRRVPGVAGIVDDDVEPAECIDGGADEPIGKARLRRRCR